MINFKLTHRHSREGGNLRFTALTEIPAIAGMMNGGSGA